MARFNTPTTRPKVTSPVTATTRTRTAQGGLGVLRDAKSELYLLAVANLVGQDTFYEGGKLRDERFAALVGQLAVDDPAWTYQLLAWLRGPEGNLRTAALVGAAEFVHARLEAEKAGFLAPDHAKEREEGGGWNRRVISAVLQRADEPGELLAYWTSRWGRKLPKPVKRGVADAVERLYTEYSLLKYDTDSKGYRFGDVLELTHASPAGDKLRWQGALFAHAIDRRHGRVAERGGIPQALSTVAANAQLRQLVAEGRTELLYDPVALHNAGMTWEDAQSLGGQHKLDKRKLWEAMIPSMGYMALLRNLRNFDQAGISDTAAAKVAAKLADPAEVAKSRQLPMRFYSAYRAAPSLRWGWALEQALGHSLANVTRLPGRTLVLVDTSGSMNAPFSKDGTVMRWDAAVVFGIALGYRCAAADVVSFSDAYWGTGRGSMPFPLTLGGSVLTEVRRWKDGGFFIGGGTDTAGAVSRHYAGHDRVVILTDEQASSNTFVDRAIPAHVPLYTWNLAGYRAGHATGSDANRHAFGGLTDAGFKMIPLLERGQDAGWPWEISAS